MRTPPGQMAISWEPRVLRVADHNSVHLQPSIGSDCKTVPKRKIFPFVTFPACNDGSPVCQSPPPSPSHVCGTPISPRPQPFPYRPELEYTEPHSSAPSAELSNSLSPLFSSFAREITRDAQISGQGVCCVHSVAVMGSVEGRSQAKGEALTREW